MVSATLTMGGLWGLGMYVFSYAAQCRFPSLVLASACFGVGMWFFSEIGIWRVSRKHKFSRWEDL